MFSQLGPLFKATFRQAESTDTRQAIRREENKGNRRQSDDEDAGDDIDLWEDSTGVSVEALQAFLLAFLNGETGQAAPENALSNPADETTEDEPSPPATPAPPVNMAASRATSAYQSMADKLEPHPHTPPVHPQKPAADVDLVHGSEIRLIHQLIDDLEILMQYGVTQLTIERADSFLDSLKAAVNQEKSKIR